MADIKVNPDTGELAIPLKEGGYKLYRKDQYKFDPDTGKYAVPADGGWKIYQHEHKAAILPFSRDIEGNTNYFDPTAGILGSIISGFTAPGDVASGKLDPQSPEGQSRAIDAAGLMLGGNPMVNSGDRAIPGIAKNFVPKKPAIPTAEALKQAGAAGFQKAEGMGVDYSTSSIKSLADDIARQLESKGIREKRASDTFSVLNEIKGGPDESVVSLVGVREIRDALQEIAGDFGPSTSKTERKAATDAIRALDGFIEEPPAASAVAGVGVGDDSAAQTGAGVGDFLAQLQAKQRAAGATIKEANANYAASARSSTITGKAERAELDAAAANSGQNLDNRTRQVLKAIVDPERPRNRRGFSEEELARIEDIVRGKGGVNLARSIGNLLGGGGGLGREITAGLGMAVGGAVGGFLGAGIGTVTLPLAGALSRKIANKLTERQVAKLDELIRKRSPLYKKALENPQMVPASPEVGMGILRLLGISADPQTGNQ